MLLSFKRTLRVIAAIAATGLFYVAFFTSLESMSFAPSTVVEALELAYFFLGLFLPLPVWVYLRHKRRSVWIREEAERWLTEGRANSERAWHIKRRRKLLRKVLWIPSILALSFFLFLPQSMGLVSHLFYRSQVVLNRHRIRPPVTAFIYGDSNYMLVLIGQGIARVGLMPYWHMEPPFSFMYFSAIQDPVERFPLILLRSETAALDRALGFGDETISCWRISRPGEKMPPGFIDLRCRTSKNDFSSGFYGSREDANVFYKTLERAAQTDSR